jgi:hypothetical protein
MGIQYQMVNEVTPGFGPTNILMEISKFLRKQDI